MCLLVEVSFKYCFLFCLVNGLHAKSVENCAFVFVVLALVVAYCGVDSVVYLFLAISLSVKK